MGERGLLSNFSGVLVGRPKAQFLDKQPTNEERAEFRRQQRETVVRMIRNYNDNAPIVLNLDFGHTDPYIPLALGKLCTIDGMTKNVLMQF
ncbi:MAG: hypothetical protein GYA55_12735 [SAR324 cluster bacterium]|uniref:LD-carboxypeptidase C-terminal domain-containing protein n=1 Tax=SAR324 cluster bacterium TaxID=2024889 RepID=A0A7X9FTG1_9DELT|nr:hypothetical protein [SAR324 cluster bacterium]